MKKLAIDALLVLSTLAVLFLLWEFREALWIFVFSLALGAATRPVVESDHLQRFPRGLVLVLVYLVGIILVVILLLALGNPLFKEMQVLSDSLAHTYETIYQRWPNGGQFEKAIAAQLPPPSDLYQALTGESGTGIARTLLGVTLLSFTTLSQVFVIIVLSIYWSIDRVHFERLWLSVLPVERRAWARNVWRDTEHGVGQYLRNEAARSILVGLALGVGLSLMGVPYPTLLGVAGAFFSLIPWLGLFLVIVLVAAAGFSVSLPVGAAAVLFSLAILVALEVFIQPRILGRLYYSPLLMVLAAIPLADEYGLLSILLAPPLAATLQLFFRSIQQPSPQEMDASVAVKMADIRQRVEQVHALADQPRTNGEMEPQTNSMLQRLDGLVEKADAFLLEENRSARRRQFMDAFRWNRERAQSREAQPGKAEPK
jgi:putative permease